MDERLRREAARAVWVNRYWHWRWGIWINRHWHWRVRYTAMNYGAGGKVTRTGCGARGAGWGWGVSRRGVGDH